MASKKAKSKKVRQATPLNHESIVETIKLKFPPNLRGVAGKMYGKVKAGKMPRRHGSSLFARKAIKAGKPKLAVMPKERERMALEYGHGASYRCVEEIHGLHPCSGMDAYRCINTAIKADKSGRFAKKIEKLCKKNGQEVPEACAIAAAMAAR